MSRVSQSAKGRISIIRAFRKTTGSRSLEHFLLRHFLSDNHKSCYRPSSTNPHREPTMVKRRKKSGRREAAASPMEPGRCFALRRAIADRRLRILKRPTTALGAARTARVERPGVQRVRRVIAEMPARLTHWPATSSCALAFSAGASRRERTWRKTESPGKWRPTC
jgi:hypothetical protein